MHLPIKLPENSSAIRTTSNFIQHHPGYRKKKPQTKIGRELFNQGASTNLVSRLTAPLSGHFGRIWENFLLSVRSQKKPQTKIGRELINQGASTNLISRLKAPLSGHFGRILENVWLRVRSPKKTRPKLVGS
ncbi:hypothetical protein [Microcoleus sp. AT9_A5]|uniref:hypothetical protein n=2 Tax=unclassified Microcoleus TaxID=2642155 RepID=UPI002FD7420C